MSLVVSTFTLYRRFWREFLLASGSVFAAIWLSIGISVALGHDLRDVRAVALFLGLLGVYYAVVLVIIIAGEACEVERISLWQGYRSSPLGLVTSIGVVGGIALAMLIVLLIPLIGIAGALYLYIRLSTGFEAAVLERLNPLEAMRQAWNLTKGRFWMAALHAVIQHGYLLALVTLMALLPHLALGVTLIAVGLPAFAIARVLSYRGLIAAQRSDKGLPPFPIG